MQIVLFYHSLVSDWNHGNAHFLRGIVTELQRRGHTVTVYEPHDAWSVQNLVRHEGAQAITNFRRHFPHLRSNRYTLATLNLDQALANADLVIVHEWNETELIHRLGRHRQAHGHYRLLFHDTHHRSLSDRETVAGYRLDRYDGVLAFGQVIAEAYLHHGWTNQVWTWHEAADTSLFYPHDETELDTEPEGDLIWIGNWGDNERTARLHEFLINPVRALQLKARIHGVRYPKAALATLEEAGIDYQGWLPNYRAPERFGGFKVTVHVPRAPYVKLLPGVPTIRVFEALACGIPLVCSPWDDAEGLFHPGRDYLVAHNGAEMQELLRMVVNEPALAEMFAKRGLETIRARHTCSHRVDELMTICRKDLGIAVDTAQQPLSMTETEAVA